MQLSERLFWRHPNIFRLATSIIHILRAKEPMKEIDFFGSLNITQAINKVSKLWGWVSLNVCLAVAGLFSLPAYFFFSMMRFY